MVSSISASDDALSRKNPRRRAILIAAAIAAAIAVLAWLAYWLIAGRYIESTDDAYLQADSVTVAPKVSGYVAEVYVGDNQAVKAGDLLARINADSYQAALNQARATVSARQADIAHAEAVITQQRANAAQAEAQERVANINARHADNEARRYTPLAAAGAETREHLASLINERDQAQATQAAQAAAAAAAKTQIQVASTELDQARAQLAAAQANVEQAELDMRDTTVRAALAGRVGDRTVRVGQYVQPGTRMMTVVPLQDIYLVANFKETQIGRMHPGQAATLSVDAKSSAKLRGVVDSFAPGTGAQFALLPPENATGNFTKIVQRVPVRIRVEPGQDTSWLLPGLSVTVDVNTRDSQNTQDTRAQAASHD